MFSGPLFTAIYYSAMESNIHRIFETLTNFLVIVFQPLFYLNGDANFRNRVLHQGLWRALKRELFETN